MSIRAGTARAAPSRTSPRSASIGRSSSPADGLGSSQSRGGTMPFEVPPLPYDYDALEPTIDADTMRLHHDKHHQAYVDNGNKALEGTEWADRPVEAILADIDLLPDDRQAAARNNVGGHANHTLFWETKGPDGGGEPSGALAEAINDTCDSVDELKTQMNDAGVKRFG